MDNLIVIAAVALILGSVIAYIRKAKKRGVRCIGCPDAERCASGGCGGNCDRCGGNCPHSH